MINLMYVVLMAMLALNISTEVLNGFSIVEESLNRTTGNSTKENEAIYRELEQIMRKNPAKARVWFQRATTVRAMSDSLFNYAQELKTLIVREADGPEGDPLHIKNKDNLEAAGVVMLSPGTGQGRKLFDAINSYRERILRLIDDPLQKQIISSNLSTTVPSAALNKNWEEYMFEDMPTAAAVTLLSKLQSDIRYAEGEVLHTLVANVGLKDIRVNKLEAIVVPDRARLYPGETITARMMLAAVDSTQSPEVYVNGQKIKGNTIQVKAGAPGKHTIQGYMLVRDLMGNAAPRLQAGLHGHWRSEAGKLHFARRNAADTALRRNGDDCCRLDECALCGLRQPHHHLHPQHLAERRAGDDDRWYADGPWWRPLHRTTHHARQSRHAPRLCQGPTGWRV